MPATGLPPEASSSDKPAGGELAPTPLEPEPRPTPTPPPTPNPPSPESTVAREQTNTVLSEDEQMALFEAELKEKDWGHQPC